MNLLLGVLFITAIIVGPVLFLVLLDWHTARSGWGEG